MKFKQNRFLCDPSFLSGESNEQGHNNKFAQDLGSCMQNSPSQYLGKYKGGRPCRSWGSNPPLYKVYVYIVYFIILYVYIKALFLRGNAYTYIIDIVDM